MDAHPDTTFAVSKRLRAAFRRLDDRERSNVIEGPVDAADAVVVHVSDAFGRLVACRPRYNLVTAWFGPADVNFNLYPSWLGRDRIVVMPVDHFPRERTLPPEADRYNLRPGALP